MRKTSGVAPNLLLHDDPRYVRWRASLKKRPGPWNKGKNKENDPSVRKISETFKIKHINNFANWRKQMIREGKILANPRPLKKNRMTATLIGLVLGDGNIHKFPRTEKLTITLGTDKPDLITFAERLTEQVFSKATMTLKHGLCKAVRITLYQKSISSRMEIPSGSRRYSKTGIPQWIWGSRTYLISCLKGLCEAEASYSVHLPSSTYNFSFHNRNPKLLSDASKALKKLGYHPEIRTYAIRLRKKDEVKSFVDLIKFRIY
ncbi:hypothetical protein A3E17_04485 [Candidatus Amesbacteria bacterium RIFCSPHIGHO2_12_FULL_48_14]|uniref:DOD-type homing endonuclease domain-containing protein n=2 Tax=Microgenomates group TaxID=1794810 RepID=A0A1F4Z6V0_9BACT|nr:MAG: hypothetical protein A3E17_04485 [Candidatus Amesbacteria bacterium RIFCSPHIGHO2_12_FULL_48_14]OGM63606.1 MAG: hypothetical protein A2893_02630 [Candidatus Woesebacteria bacterium RIFCSPLOWO2_01_FULL_39_25]